MKNPKQNFDPATFYRPMSFAEKCEWYDTLVARRGVLLTPAERAVIMALIYRHHDPLTGACRPSQAELATTSGASIKVVERTISKLRGVIDIYRTTKPNGHHGGNLYRIVPLQNQITVQPLAGEGLDNPHVGAGWTSEAISQPLAGEGLDIKIDPKSRANPSLERGWTPEIASQPLSSEGSYLYTYVTNESEELDKTPAGLAALAPAEGFSKLPGELGSALIQAPAPTPTPAPTPVFGNHFRSPEYVEAFFRRAEEPEPVNPNLGFSGRSGRSAMRMDDGRHSYQPPGTPEDKTAEALKELQAIMDSFDPNLEPVSPDQIKPLYGDFMSSALADPAPEIQFPVPAPETITSASLETPGYTHSPEPEALSTAFIGDHTTTTDFDSLIDPIKEAASLLTPEEAILEAALSKTTHPTYAGKTPLEKTHEFVKAFNSEALAHLPKSPDLASATARKGMRSRKVYLRDAEVAAPWLGKDGDSLSKRWKHWTKARREADALGVTYDDFIGAGIVAAFKRGWRAIPTPQQIACPKLMGSVDKNRFTIPNLLPKAA